MSARPFHRRDDFPSCGATLDDGTTCERAPEYTNALRLCIDCTARHVSAMLPPPDDDCERAAIVAEGMGDLRYVAPRVG